MKKIILLLILILNINCSSTNTKKSVQNRSLEEKIDLLEYKLILPVSWHPYLDIHKYVAFSPLNQSDKDYKVSIHIRKIPPNEHNYISLTKIAEKAIKNSSRFLRVHSNTITLNQSKFGESCINKYSYSWNSNNFKIEKIYFKYKENYYYFAYSSKERYFHKYLNDSKIIFKSLNFKEL